MHSKIAERLTHHLETISDRQYAILHETYLSHRADRKIVHKKDMGYQFINRCLRPYITVSEPGYHVILVLTS